MRTEKLLSLVAFIVFSISVSAQSSGFYNFKVKTLEGENFDFSTLKGKKVMIVNVASKCGNTPQYKDLEEIYEKYKDDNFVIIGFPANNFMNQEPGTAGEIRKFCTENYGVTFPLMEKISVKGDDMHPLYQWLTSKQKNGVMDAPVTWNFQKFLIDENGKLIDVIPPKDKVTSDKVLAWISSK
jgi:glutathione peroxidase